MPVFWQPRELTEIIARKPLGGCIPGFFALNCSHRWPAGAGSSASSRT